MLQQKKIEKNKLYLYLAIIGLMFSGTVFFVYKNFRLSNAQPTMASQTESQIAASGSGIEAKKTDDIKNKLKNLEILNNARFKRLINNTVKIPEVKPGKEDPFKPYE